MSWAQWLRSLGASEGALSLMTLGGHSSPLSALYLLRQIMLHRDLGGLSEDRRRLRSDRAPAWRAASASIQYNCELVRLDRSGPIRATVRSRRARGDHHRRSRGAHPALLRAAAYPGRSAVLAGEDPDHRQSRLLPGHPISSSRPRPGSGRRRTFRAARGPTVRGTSGTWALACRDGRAPVGRPPGGPEVEAKLLAAQTGGALSLWRGLGPRPPFLRSRRKRRRSWRTAGWTNPRPEGAFSIFHPGQMSHWTNTILRPEGRVHFAGEHTSAHSGWIEGALWSGDHVSQEILQQ